MSYDFRASLASDAHHLIDIDLKCFDSPWSPDQWRVAAQIAVGAVATHRDTPIGFVIFSHNANGDVEILKLGVKREHQHQGIGSRLLLNVLIFAAQLSARTIATVPESLICPGQPADISGWLSRRGFRAEPKLLKNEFHFYDRNEDGIVFIRGVASDESREPSVPPQV